MKEHCLQSMGIQTWELRGHMPGAKQVFPSYVYILLSENQQKAGYLILDCFDVANSRIVALLNKMLAAIGLHIGAPMLAEDLITQIESGLQEPLLILGQASAQMLLKTSAYLEDLCNQNQTCGQCAAIVTYHPETLLKKPALKRQAWCDLQRFQCVKLGG